MPFIQRIGRKVPIEVPAEELRRVVGENDIWVWIPEEGEPEVVERAEEPEE